MNRLKYLRDNKNLSQKELSSLLNCCQTTYSRYETGDLNIPINVLIKLAIYYNTSVDYLIGLTDNKNSYKNSN